MDNLLTLFTSVLFYVNNGISLIVRTDHDLAVSFHAGNAEFAAFCRCHSGMRKAFALRTIYYFKTFHNAIDRIDFLLFSGCPEYSMSGAILMY